MDYLFARQCDHCKRGMNQGFVVAGGEAYYCSEECRNHYYNEKEWNDMYDDEGDNYYTEWEDTEDFQYVLSDGVLKERDGFD